MDDLKLWTNLKKGSHQALKQVYDENIISLGNYAQKFTSDTGLIEDTIHDIFVQIWNKRESIGNTDSIIKYLCVTLRRELIRRVEKSHHIIGYEHAENKETDFSLSIEDLLITEESTVSDRRNLENAMNLLSNRQKEAIYLRYYEEMEYEQICEIMNINYQSVRNLISKGILELRNYLTFIFILISILK
jgi:RNA polymerase sigma factor (sigma-70 family)